MSPSQKNTLENSFSRCFSDFLYHSSSSLFLKTENSSHFRYKAGPKCSESSLFPLEKNLKKTAPHLSPMSYGENYSHQNNNRKKLKPEIE